MNSPTPLRVLLPAVVALAYGACVTTPTSPAETAALATLASSAGLHEKARACQQLAVVGGPAAVPALAALLADEVLSDYARSGLEAISSPAAGAALRAALRTTEGRQLAGVVNSLGVRREAAAVPELQTLVRDAQRGVASEALASLGMIATDGATQTLREVAASGPAALRAPAAHAALTAAEQLTKVGNAAGARQLLEAVSRMLPPGPLQSAVQARQASLAAQLPAKPNR